MKLILPANQSRIRWLPYVLSYYTNLESFKLILLQIIPKKSNIWPACGFQGVFVGWLRGMLICNISLLPCFCPWASNLFGYNVLRTQHYVGVRIRALNITLDCWIKYFIILYFPLLTLRRNCCIRAYQPLIYPCLKHALYKFVVQNSFQIYHTKLILALWICFRVILLEISNLSNLHTSISWRFCAMNEWYACMQ